MNKFKRLILDIETTPNIVYSWAIGHDINIGYNSIVKERAIICIGYKWEHEKRTRCITWDSKKQCDKKMLEEFAEVINQADEVVGHNSDSFDIKWVRARAAKHDIYISPLIKGVDTLKLAKGYFRFNSNRLDYLAQFLGVGEKIETTYDLWKDVMNGDDAALEKMVKYCKHDVEITQRVFEKLQAYAPTKTHVGVVNGGEKYHCPECGSDLTQRRGFRTTAAGDKKQICSCNNCGRNFTIAAASSKKMDQNLKKAA